MCQGGDSENGVIPCNIGPVRSQSFHISQIWFIIIIISLVDHCASALLVLCVYAFKEQDEYI